MAKLGTSPLNNEGKFGDHELILLEVLQQNVIHHTNSIPTNPVLSLPESPLK